MQIDGEELIGTEQEGGGGTKNIFMKQYSLLKLSSSPVARSSESSTKARSNWSSAASPGGFTELSWAC